MILKQKHVGVSSSYSILVNARMKNGESRMITLRAGYSDFQCASFLVGVWPRCAPQGNVVLSHPKDSIISVCHGLRSPVTINND